MHRYRAVPHARDHGGLLGRAVRGGAAEGHQLAALDGDGVLQLLARQAGRRLAEVLVAGGHHNGGNGLRGGAVDHTAAVSRAVGQVALGKRKSLGKPVQDNGLELCYGRRADPVEGCAGKGGRVHFTQHCWEAG